MKVRSRVHCQTITRSAADAGDHDRAAARVEQRIVRVRIGDEISLGCNRSHALAVAVPYRRVSVLVATSGLLQVWGHRRRILCCAWADGRRSGCGPWAVSRGVAPVRAHPPDDLHRQVAQQPRDAGSVVVGIQHHQDLWIALAPVASVDLAQHDVADLVGGDRGDVRAGRQPDRVQGVETGEIAYSTVASTRGL